MILGHALDILKCSHLRLFALIFPLVLLCLSWLVSFGFTLWAKWGSWSSYWKPGALTRTLGLTCGPVEGGNKTQPVLQENTLSQLSLLYRVICFLKPTIIILFPWRLADLSKACLLLVSHSIAPDARRMRRRKALLPFASSEPMSLRCEKFNPWSEMKQWGLSVTGLHWNRTKTVPIQVNHAEGTESWTSRQLTRGRLWMSSSLSGHSSLH